MSEAMQTGQAIGLIMMLEKEGKRSRSHGMPPEVIQAQAESIGLPVLTAATSWEDYLDETYTAERIVKNSDSAIGYSGTDEVFSFRGVSDFSLFETAGDWGCLCY